MHLSRDHAGSQDEALYSAQSLPVVTVTCFGGCLSIEEVYVNEKFKVLICLRVAHVYVGT